MNIEELDNSRAEAKITQWERKLLDLSLRNSLINMKIKGNMVPIFAASPDELQNKLAEDVDFNIRPRNDKKDEKKEEKEEEKQEEKQETAAVEENAAEEKPAEEAVPSEPSAETAAEAVEPEAQSEKQEETEEEIAVKEYDLENLSDISGFENLINEGFEKHKLYSSLTRSELDTSIKSLYRAAKVSIEENGANTLYLALGVLRWYDPGSKAPHYAPLIMIPVDLVRKSIILGYVIRRRDEDPLINITLLEKLKQDFGIVSDPKEIMVADATGIDVDKVLDNYRAIITGQEGWEIFNTCVLGMFSFTNFVMWNDLHSRRDQIGENKVVKSLLEGKIAWEASDMTVPEKLDESDCFLPITADSSQLYAIKAAKQGESFVLHGPPGTGKSQTITSMIADLMASGKTVLFAAEKKAALEVVYSRLDKIGLGPFCLEIHSNKTKKSKFFEKLAQAVEIRKKASDGEYDKMQADLARRRHELDGYCAALHRMNKCGFSLFELISIYTENSSAPDVEPFAPEFADTVNGDTYEAVINSLNSLLAAGAELRDPTSLNFVRTSEYSQQLKTDLPAITERFGNASDKLSGIYSQALDTLSLVELSYGHDFASVRSVCDIADTMNKWFDYPSKWAEIPDWDAFMGDINRYSEHVKNAGEAMGRILQTWTEDFLSQDPVALTNELNLAESKWALAKKMAVSSLYKKIAVYDRSKKADENLRQHFADLKVYKDEKQAASDLLNGPLNGRITPDEANDTASLKAAYELAQKLLSVDRTDRLRTVLAGGEKYRTLWSGLTAAYAEFDSAHDELEERLGVRPVHDSETLESMKEIHSSLVSDGGNLRERIILNDAMTKVRSLGGVNLTNAFNGGTVPADCLVSAFRKAFAKLFIVRLIDSDEVLKSFSGHMFEEKISAFRKINDEFIDVTRQEIYLRIASNLPDLAKEARASSALGILQHAIKSAGRGVSLRTIFSQIPELILKLCPCLLMSPISVAQYLEPGKVTFDMVIFDEASQLPTCKAVGVIARGRDCVIVGDPNQMPPTSFFQSENYDEENYQVEDLESILDDCLALSMPGSHLQWHYRSKHESLISFSNKCFYENKLYTFPSSDDRDRKVTFIECDGTFDRGRTRTNRKEAEMVVDEIVRRMNDPVLSGRSIGVVTFNISQQNLIDDMLAERIKNDSELENRIYGGEEPLFIKNLENVQGDERDVILFSVAYGTDETGKVFMNFGPLSQDGGWRRLNVAVTRARYEMMVFSSLSPEQIKITSDTARGVAAFRSFLEYAKGRETWDTGVENQIPSEAPLIDRDKAYMGVAREIVSCLKGSGYDADINVGRSEYKVDIAVIDPEDPGKYILGIMMDGRTYRENKTTSGREIYQENVLRGLGWNTMRVWSVDWWEDRDKVMSRIIETITGIIESGNKPEEPAEQTEESPAEAAQPEAEPEKAEQAEPVREEPEEIKKQDPQEAPAGEST